MNNTFIDIQFKGVGFSPKKLRELTGLPIEILIESNEIAKIGRYKGKSSPYGLGLLKLDNNESNIINKYSELLLKNKAALQESNASEIIFDIDTSIKNKASFTIDSELLKKLSFLNAQIQFQNESPYINKIETSYIKVINLLFSLINDENGATKKIELLSKALKGLEKQQLISSDKTTKQLKVLLKNLTKNNSVHLKSLDT